MLESLFEQIISSEFMSHDTNALQGLISSLEEIKVIADRYIEAAEGRVFDNNIAIQSGVWMILRAAGVEGLPFLAIFMELKDFSENDVWEELVRLVEIGKVNVEFKGGHIYYVIATPVAL